jgi:hypothetical protein
VAERDTAVVERAAARGERDNALAQVADERSAAPGLRSAADSVAVEAALRARAEAEVERLRAELARAQPTAAEIRELLARHR